MYKPDYETPLNFVQYIKYELEPLVMSGNQHGMIMYQWFRFMEVSDINHFNSNYNSVFEEHKSFWNEPTSKQIANFYTAIIHALKSVELYDEHIMVIGMFNNHEMSYILQECIKSVIVKQYCGEN